MKQFETTCVCADAEDINLMVDNEQENERHWILLKEGDHETKTS
jgi:hypothetical protein